MSDVLLDLAARIKMDMERKGLSQKAYSDKSGITETILKKMLKGEQNVTTYTLSLLAKEFNTPSLTLYFDKPTSQNERKKHQDIQSILLQLSSEHPQVVAMIEKTMGEEIEKMKKLLQSFKTIKRPNEKAD